MEFNKPYKITLWEDVTSYLVRRDNTEIVVSEILPDDTLLNTWIDERCIAIIGSNTMDTPIRAFDPKFTQEINGKKTLTFSIAMRYWDYEEEDFKNNPFINLLVNERRVKLQYDGEWYDFFIKEKEESSEKYTFNYTCEDVYLTELGRNGYEVELNTELENNLGTAIELGTKILTNTDWEIAPIGTGINDSDSLVQTVKEGLYLFTVETGFEARCLKDFEYRGITVHEGDTRTIPSNSTIYIFYSTFVNQEPLVQFLFADNGMYVTDDHGFIINSPNWSYTPSSLPEFYGVTQAELDDPDEFQLNMSSYFGKKVVRLQESIYLPSIDKYCTSYCKDPSTNPLYYCYKETEYASIEEIQNLLVNTEGFLDTNGWGNYSEEINTYLPVSGELNGQMTLQLKLTPGWVAYESFSDAQAAFNAGKRVYYLSEGRYILVRPTETLLPSITYFKNETCYNTGFFNNRKLLTEMVASDKDVFVLMLKMDSADDPTLSSVRAAVYAEEVMEDGIANDLLVEFIGPGTIDSDGYLTLYGKMRRSISYNTLLDTYTNITFYLYGNGEYSLAKALCFKKILDANGNLIIPDLQTTADTIIREKYYFFEKSQITNDTDSTNDLVYEAIQYDETGFTPYYPPSMEKVTMIEAEKSNYFNLIQTICEKFECWAKFIIGHDDYGATLSYYELTEDSRRVDGKIYYSFSGSGTPQTDDYYDHTKWNIDDSSSVSGLYERKSDKKIAFKEYIGEDNFTGFRYGINLKSIVRNVKSNDITTKLIVEENSNEFAKDKSCSIQKAALNPSGENMLFNFQYFINHRLIDEVELNKDLYGSSDKTGLALLPNLRKVNDISAKIISEIPDLKMSIDTVENSLLILRNQDTEISENINKLDQYIYATGYADISPELLEKFEYLRDLYTRRQYNNAVEITYSDILGNLETLLEEYNNLYETKTTQLEEIMTNKMKLLKEFYKKYYRYIREGTWISEDYYDEDLYYLDAQMVLYTSAFPQIKYTINVIEISELEGYEPYTFSIGDKTYIEDTEFFGWDRQGRPYKEDIVISKITYHLDDPSQNSIEVQNYKTQFEDLFQRIAAETQSLQYSTGEYKRAAEAIGQGYVLDGTLMQNSLRNNELIIQNAHNQSVVWDDDGITISNSREPNEIVKMTSNGIVLTSDGGNSWHTGISATGINADVITAGQLDTNLIRIFNGEKQTFQWNSTGINAYAQNSTTQEVNYNTFVRFDQYGLYGLVGDPNWDPDVLSGDPPLVGLAKVKRDAYFSLTWDGLKIRINRGAGEEKVEVINIQNDNFIVYNDGSIVAKDGTFKGTVYATDGTFSGTLSAAKVSGALTSNGDGWLEGIGIRTGSDGNDPPYYNFYVDSNGEVKAGGNATDGPNFHVDTNGNVTIKGDVTLGPNSVISWNNLDNGTQTTINNAAQNASDALDAAEGSVVKSQQIWYCKNNTTSITSGPSTWVTDTSGGWNIWTTAIPKYDSRDSVTSSNRNRYYFTCYQYELADGTIFCTAPRYEKSVSIASENALVAFANGLYKQGTFISENKIESPLISGGEIEGAVIAGGEFTNIDRGAYLTIGDITNSTWGDLELRGRNPQTGADYISLKVSDNFLSTSLSVREAIPFIDIAEGYEDEQTTAIISDVTIRGRWHCFYANSVDPRPLEVTGKIDFSGATVTGVSARFG